MNISKNGKENQKTTKLFREFSSGGVVFKKNKKILWLIIRPKDTSRWQLPKGKIDEGETSKEAARREVKEEGGVEAKVLEKLGNSQYFFVLKGQRIFKTVTYFLMEYVRDTEKGHDWEVEEASFLPFDEAHERLTFKDDKKMLDKAKEILDKGIQENLV